MSNLLYCFLLSLVNIYLINSLGGEALDDNEGHLTGWTIDSPGDCRDGGPDCIFTDPTGKKQDTNPSQIQLNII